MIHGSASKCGMAWTTLGPQWSSLGEGLLEIGWYRRPADRPKEWDCRSRCCEGDAPLHAPRVVAGRLVKRRQKTTQGAAIPAVTSQRTAHGAKRGASPWRAAQVRLASAVDVTAAVAARASGRAIGETACRAAGASRGVVAAAVARAGARRTVAHSRGARAPDAARATAPGVARTGSANQFAARTTGRPCRRSSCPATQSNALPQSTQAGSGYRQGSS
jgi:hypothetical protein